MIKSLKIHAEINCYFVVKNWIFRLLIQFFIDSKIIDYILGIIKQTFNFACNL